jgi:general secretion pathway protein K
VSNPRQDGVALVTALLVTALAVTLVANLFWQQQVMVRGMEGQQLRLQARLLLHSALDDARLALRDAGAAQGQVTLEGRWHLPPRQRGERADLLREIVDAQSRFDPALAAAVAEALAAAPSEGSARLALREVDDLLAVPGITPAVLARLRPFVTMLPEPAGVNVNTASAEVLTSVANVTLQEAQALVAKRRQANFRDTSDFALRLNDKETLEGVNFHVSSDYFLVQGRVRLERVCVGAQALVRRRGDREAALLWLRER